MTLTPAYGRDYKSGKAAIADFEDEKDFQVADLFSGGGSYANINDLRQSHLGANVMIRYDRLRKVVAVRVKAA